MASFGPKIAVVLLLSLLLVLSAAQRQRKPGNSVSIKAADRLISRHRADDNDQEDDTDNPGTANKFKEGRCSYYCFFVPLKDEKVNFHPYTSINCSHLVYGFATINPQNELDPVTSFDMLYSDSFANYRQVTDLGKGLQMQVLLGIRGDGQKDQFMETQWTHEKVIKSIVWNTRSNNFGFMDKLSAAINADHEQYPQQNRLVVVLGMSARWVPKVTGRMSKLAKHFHAFYLWNDDINTSQDPSISVQVDPLGPSEKVPLMDTIKGNAEKLASGGIPKSKIIVGLTAWARSYVFAKNVKGEHGATIDNVGDPGDVTKKTDGRLAYYEICNFQRKLKWISSYGFGGVGLFSLQADDALGNVCGEGVLPLHTYVFQAYSCSIRRSDETRGKESGSQACTRLCSFNPDHATNSFNFITLDPNWCSHIILSTATVVSYPSLDVSFSQKSRKIVMNYNAWSTPAKPYLILSIGADQGPESWRQALQTTKRPAFIDKLVKLMEDNGADGVDIAWTSVENALDMTLLYALLTDLRANVTNTKQIFVCASHSATFYRQFNYKLLANMADYVVLQGYRFHAYNRPFTGHHSPLFGTRDVFNDPKLTIEGMVGKWLENVPSEKLIVALSAEAMSQFFRIIGNRSDRAIGDPANSQKQITSRTNSPGKVTQTELCQILKNPNAQTQFIEAIGAPYLISGDEFIAYDDDKSMLIKSVWASMQDLGGIALHGMEMDNIAGECPSGSPFHLLKSIVKAQMCNQCTDPTQPIVFPVGTNATDLLQGIASQTSRLMNVTESSCGHRFRVVCTYHLPTDSASTGLSMDSLPYDKCDEIVVQKFRLTASGKVEAEEALPKETLANLTSMITKIS
uniref:GH18 domain-containing protein n=1 Tax=Ditylenchus dipsaci TaxID=166011 RepID=A0A915D8M5_9BILA